MANKLIIALLLLFAYNANGQDLTKESGYVPYSHNLTIDSLSERHGEYHKIIDGNRYKLVFIFSNDAGWVPATYLAGEFHFFSTVKVYKNDKLICDKQKSVYTINGCCMDIDKLIKEAEKCVN